MPCQLELPAFQRLYAVFKDQGVECLLVSIDEDSYKVKPFIEKNSYSLPVLYSDRKVEADYAVTGTPPTFLIDPQGRIQLRSHGYSSDNERIFKIKIQELLRSDHQGH